MTELLMLLRIDAAAVALAAVIGSTAYVGAHHTEATAALAEGLAQVAAWRDSLAALGRASAAAAVTALLWLLAHILRAHGRHRAGDA
jgi:hypothetical protein